MRKDALFFGVAGVFFGLLTGWIIGSHHDRAPSPSTQAVEAPPAAVAQQKAPPLDEKRAAELKAAAERSAADADTRVQLANLYFDSERYNEAAQWYEQALKIDPRNANASTDLGIVYYYTNQPDRAIAQFEKSLAVDPGHSKTLLNLGIVKAFGKQDLEGASKAWQRVVEIAPNTPEGQAAKKMLDGLRSAHPGGGSTGSTGS